MSLNLQLTALTLPANTEFEGTPQGDLNQKAQYLQITGQDSFNGVNYGPTTPDEDNRDKPWFKTDSGYNPLGWYSWNGSSWTPIPMVTPQGTTTERNALVPVAGQLFFDTTINVQLIYERSQWRTLDGSPGDTKFVRAADLATALVNNPGWAEDTDCSGRVIAGAITDGTGTGYNATVGVDEVTLAHDNLPPFYLNFPTGVDAYGGQHQNGAQPAGVYPVVTGLSTTLKTANFVYDDATTGQIPVDVRQQTIYRWCIYKL